jgi:XTP/dITP diphosphohydrolase
MTPRRWVLASGNEGKRLELAALLEPLGVELLPQSLFGLDGVEEHAPSFIENALLKARAASAAAGLPALADDSGLLVDALGGAPGVRSARYAGEGASDADNVAALLAALASVPTARRSARFLCVLVALAHPEDPDPLVARGAWEGRIAETPRGTSGFGYDPVFELPGEGLTAAQLPATRKNMVSHRGQALAGLAARLAER